MGFFSRLFGKEEEKERAQSVDMENLPVQTAQISGRATLNLTEKADPRYRELGEMERRQRRELEMDPEYRAEVEDGQERLGVEYAAELEYAVVDADQFRDSAGDDPVEALSEAFYVCITAISSIRVEYIEGDNAAYAQCILDRFNSDFGDWGIQGMKLTLTSLAPTEEYREYYEAYRKVWG